MLCYYSPHYAFALPDGHPFPMYKYEQAAKILLEDGIISADELIDPGLADEADVLRVHEPAYLASLKNGEIAPQAIRRLGFPWSELLLKRSLTAVAGTIAACDSAIKYGVASNLAGGTHHSFPDCGEGYCVLNDVAIAIRKLQEERPGIKVLIVDLDAHQGNGNNFVFAADPNVFTLSLHVGSNYPSRKYPGDLDIALPKGVKGEIYLVQMKEALSAALARFEPDLAIYVGGVDVHVNDRFGQMGLTEDDMYKRDIHTLTFLRSQGLPVATVFGGGYNRDKAMTAILHCQTLRIAALAAAH